MTIETNKTNKVFRELTKPARIGIEKLTKLTPGNQIFSYQSHP